jgi:hypothetical protein
MDAKTADSQEPPPGQDPPQGHEPSTSTPTPSDLSPEDLELTQRHGQTLRNPSPPKKAGTEPGWEELLDSLSAKDIEISGLDYAPQQELRSSPQARVDFLASNLTTPEALHFDPEQGNLQKVDLSKTRPFTDTQPLEPPTLKVQEGQFKDAILQHHQTTCLPNHPLLMQACKQFYPNSVLEQYYIQIQIVTIDSRLKTLAFHSHLLECTLLVILY